MKISNIKLEICNWKFVIGNSWRSQVGFSLVELVIVIILAGIAGTILVSIFVQNNGVFYTQTAKVNQGLSLNNTSTEIQEVLRAANGIASNNPIGSPQYSTNSTTLVLTLASIDSLGNVIEGKYDYIIITRDAQKAYILKKIVFPDPSSSRKGENLVLATKLSQIEFKYLDNSGNPVSPLSASKVNYIINLSEKASYGTENASASSVINLRNN